MVSANVNTRQDHQPTTTLPIIAGPSRWELLGKLASAALADEARLTPKPALVDERGTGAHRDLTLESMLLSAQALEPFFQEMARLSLGAQPDIHLREQLAECGRRAEIAMHHATGGSNSHRGAIWCLGLLVASTAIHESSAEISEIAHTAGRLARLRDSKAPEWETHGLAVQKAFGVKGARAEAEAGFPHVTRVGWPHLQRRRLAGASQTSCKLDTLLMIMSTLDDTCLLYRGGRLALKTAKLGAQEVLALGGCDTAVGMARLFQLDKDLIELNASPGGSADLLAATMFLDSLGYVNNNPAEFDFLHTVPAQVDSNDQLNDIQTLEKLNGNARI